MITWLGQGKNCVKSQRELIATTSDEETSWADASVMTEAAAAVSGSLSPTVEEDQCGFMTTS